MLNGEQLYEVTNLYNTGVGLGFAQAFAAGSSWNDMDIAYSQARQFWPGGPIVSPPGALGAAITHDKQPLPLFPWNPPPEPRTFPNTYEIMRDNERKVIQILIDRTPYAHYCSFGALIAIFECNALAAKDMKFPDCMIPWNISKQTLDQIIHLGNSICRQGENDWRTPLNITFLRELRDVMRRVEGPNVIEITGTIRGVGDVGEYVYNKAQVIRKDMGNSIAQFAESGVHGVGCVWPNI